MKYLGPPSSGSIAGVTHAHSRAGQYTRTRAGRGGTGSARVNAAVAAWQSLTPELQHAWSTWADTTPRTKTLGRRVISGYCAFISAALSQLSRIGFIGTTTPQPTSLYRLQEVTFSVSGVGALTITWQMITVAVGLPGDGNGIIIDVSGQPVSTGVTFGPGPHGWKRLASFALDGLNPVTWPTTFTTGQTFFVRSREWRDDFLIGPPIISRLTVP